MQAWNEGPQARGLTEKTNTDRALTEYGMKKYGGDMNNQLDITGPDGIDATFSGPPGNLMADTVLAGNKFKTIVEPQAKKWLAEMAASPGGIGTGGGGRSLPLLREAQLHGRGR